MKSKTTTTDQPKTTATTKPTTTPTAPASAPYALPSIRWRAWRATGSPDAVRRAAEACKTHCHPTAVVLKSKTLAELYVLTDESPPWTSGAAITPMEEVRDSALPTRLRFTIEELRRADDLAYHHAVTPELVDRWRSELEAAETEFANLTDPMVNPELPADERAAAKRRLSESAIVLRDRLSIAPAVEDLTAYRAALPSLLDLEAKAADLETAIAQARQAGDGDTRRALARELDNLLPSLRAARAEQTAIACRIGQRARAFRLQRRKELLVRIKIGGGR